MVSWEGLSFITSPIGFPVRLHPETAQCINIEKPKIFVNADLTKELPKKMLFNLLGKEVLVEYTYPWVPPRCTNCMKWGHLEKACLAPKKIQTQQTDEVEDGEIVGDLEKNTESSEGDKQSENLLGENSVLRLEETEVENEQIVTKQLVLEPTNMEEAMVVVDTEPNTSSGEIFNEVTKVAETVEEKWSDVTPGKGSRSPTKKIVETEQNSIVSSSRFLVLSPTDEDGEESNDLISEGSEEVGLSESNEEVVAIAVKPHINENEKEKDVTIARQSLPRGSKDKHKFLSDSAALKAKEFAPAQSKKMSRKKY